MVNLVNSIHNVLSLWDLERIIDVSLEGVIVAIILAFFLGLYSLIFLKSDLNPITLKKLKIKLTPPTATINNMPAVGFDIDLPISIQNIGKRSTVINKIIYDFKQREPFIHGSTNIEEPNQILSPGDIGEYHYKEILNLKKNSLTGCFSFDIHICIIPKNNKIILFDAVLFLNPSHNSIRSYHIKNKRKINRFNYWVMRKFKNKKIVNFFSKNISKGIIEFINRH